MEAASKKVGLFMKKEFELQFLESGIYGDLLKGYIQRKAHSSREADD